MRRRRRRGATRERQLSASDVRDALKAHDSPRWNDLVRHLGIAKGAETHRLRRLLRGLEHLGEVGRSPDGHYALLGEPEVVKVVESFGKLVAEGSGAELPPGSNVRAGDRVELPSGRQRGWRARRDGGLRVVEPSTEPLIGCVVEGFRRRFVESLDPAVRGRVEIEDDDRSARDGDIVEMSLLWQDRGRYNGRILSVLHARDEADRAAVAMLRSYRVPVDWPDDFDLRAPQSVTADDAAGRRDLTNLPLVTIDGPDARDFDDAVYAEPHSEGGWRLVVAIADVAHYVKPGSPLDIEARRRGNSVYLPDRVIPMLPESLSNGICSLVPQEQRLALVCDMQVSAAGTVSSSEFYDAVIRSHARLTYEEAAAEPPMLAALFEVYRALRARRSDRGAVEFESPEPQLTLQDGRVSSVALTDRNDAHGMIEEAMIAANVCAARRVEAPLYRVHEAPQGEKLDQLVTALAFAGVRLSARDTTPGRLRDLMSRALGGTPRNKWLLEILLLRSMPQARYDPDNVGHFGLALPQYAHFTSPIRRYADLTVHRMIKSDASPPTAEWLSETGAHISMTERRADDVGRAVSDWLQCDYIKDRTGERFSGVVVGVTDFGLFVRLKDVFVQGLVHVSNLGRDYFHFAPESMALVGETSGGRFALGDELDVVLEDVEVETRRVDLVPLRRRGARKR
ncbi:MAG: VacB/RNase II family 3'-5' exoribonuclease [Gammaproteobacteria bacterium]|nr:VacB/RNase II family 3'-5' exoribonuclease [Gammaproteobacteria bacterium]